MKCDVCGQELKTDGKYPGDLIRCECGIDHIIPEEDQTIECPYCFEHIDHEATSCMHCGESFRTFEGYGRAIDTTNPGARKLARQTKKSELSCAWAAVFVSALVGLVFFWPVLVLSVMILIYIAIIKKQ